MITRAEYYQMLARCWPGNQKMEDPPKQRSEPEKKIQKDIEDYLKTLVPECAWHRSRMDKATTCEVGEPDFIICYRGYTIVLEVKVPGKKPSDKQRERLAFWSASGASTAVVYNVNFLKGMIKQIDREHETHKTTSRAAA